MGIAPPYGSISPGRTRMIFLFFGSPLAHLEPELDLFEVWETMVGQIITIIANVIMWRLEQNVTITIVVQL